MNQLWRQISWKKRIILDACVYQQNRDLIQVGAYEHGVNPELDEAIKKRPLFEAFMQQDASERFDFDATQTALNKVGHDVLGYPRKTYEDGTG